MGWFILLVLVLLHLAWYGVTRARTRAPLPEETTVASFQADMYRRFGIAVDSEAIVEEYLEANGFRLHLDILENEAPAAPVLVFIPGTSVYAGIYVEFLQAMKGRGFTVIGFDPRGHGRSSGLRGDYTMDTIVDDALAVVNYARKRFGGPVAVAGSSQGGMAAFYAAARDDSLAAVVCHNIADLNGRDNLILARFPVPAWSVPVNDLFLSIYQKFAVPIWLYLDLSQEILKDGTDAATYVREDPLCVTWITLRALRSLMKTPLARPVERIKVPVMLIHSDKDNIFPREYVEGLFARLTGAKKYLLVKDRDHLVLTNYADEVVGPVADWLQSVMK